MEVIINLIISISAGAVVYHLIYGKSLSNASGAIIYWLLFGGGFFVLKYNLF